jgi:Domain of unknown function (DUF1707)
MPEETSSTSGSPDPAPPALRASHADRDRTVDTLRVAAGDGRLTAAELDERLEAALTARTIAELTALVTDLPSVAGTSGGAEVEVSDVIRIGQRGGSVLRDGRWAVPRRLELQLSWCDATFDLTEAVIGYNTLRIDVDMRGGTLLLVIRPGIVVNTDSLTVDYGKVKVPHPADPGTPDTFRVELTGRLAYGRVATRIPRRTFPQWLLRRPARPGDDPAPGRPAG